MTAVWTALAVAVGGALGALARVGLEHTLGNGPLDLSTLVVTLTINTLGAAALGLLRRPQALQPPPWLRVGLSVGFLGAFTTWSAVMVQVQLVTSEGKVWLGIGYLIATIGLGLLAAKWGLSSTAPESRGESR